MDCEAVYQRVKRLRGLFEEDRKIKKIKDEVERKLRYCNLKIETQPRNIEAFTITQKFHTL